MVNLLSDLSEIVGKGHVLTGSDIGDRYKFDFLRKYEGEPAVVVRPNSTAEVSAILKIAYRDGVSVTVVGGQTGLVAGAMTPPGGIALSLERMDRIEEIDTSSMTMIVQAGCIVQMAQEAAERDNTFLPLDLGSRGSAMIGGVIATNAGGNRVLRWGMMRDMVLGLEVVLADGTVVSSLTKMIKDNAGYNWKHLLIGSEGTLGVVTRAVLRLRPLPTTTQTAIVAMNSFEDTVRLLRKLDSVLSGRLSSFELMWGNCYDRVTDFQFHQRPRPLPEGYNFYAVVEAMGSDPAVDETQFEHALMSELNAGAVADAVLAKSESQRAALWAVRDDMSPAFVPLAPFCLYDVSMSLSAMPSFVDQVYGNLSRAFPKGRAFFYGHAGDGNLHAIVNTGEPGVPNTGAVDTIIFEAVRQYNGSISAEHGIGTTRKQFLNWTRSESEVWLMRKIKDALDPKQILNPGKVL